MMLCVISWGSEIGNGLALDAVRGSWNEIAGQKKEGEADESLTLCKCRCL